MSTNSSGLMEIQWINAQQAVVSLHGEFRMATAAILRKKLLQVARKGPRVFVLNLSAVQALDTAGIAVLVEVYRLLADHGGRLNLVGLHDRLKILVQLTHLDQLLDLCNSEEAALSKGRQHQDGCN